MPNSEPAVKSPADTAAHRERIGDHVVIYRTSASPCWYVQYNLHGKQHRVSLKTTSKKRAREVAKKKNAQLFLGQAEPPSLRPLTIADAIVRYLQTVTGRGRSPKTIEVYRSRLGVFAAFSEARGVKYLADTSANHLEDYQKELAEKGYVPPKAKKPLRGTGFKKSANLPRTVRDKLKLVRQLIKWARKRGMLKTDPAAGYDLPPAVKTQAYCWNLAELSLILTHAPMELKNLFEFLSLTGLRCGELCWLTQEDLVLEPPHIKIRAKICPLSGKTWKPKHGTERIVPLCPQALAIAQVALAASSGPWFFFAADTVGNQKGQWRPGRIWKALKATRQKAGVSRGTVHTFRHVFCSFLANQGVSPYRIMKVMGHDSLEIVLLYCHATEEELIEAVVCVPFDKMLPPVAPTPRQAPAPVEAAQPASSSSVPSAVRTARVSLPSTPRGQKRQPLASKEGGANLAKN